MEMCLEFRRVLFRCMGVGAWVSDQGAQMGLKGLEYEVLHRVVLFASSTAIVQGQAAMPWRTARLSQNGALAFWQGPAKPPGSPEEVILDGAFVMKGAHQIGVASQFPGGYLGRELGP